MHHFLIFFSWYCKIIINIFIELENIHGKMYIMWVCNSKKIHKVILPCFIWFLMQLIGILIKHLPCDLKYAQSVKAMAPHSSTLAWTTPGTEEPHRLQSMGSLRVRHDWATSLSIFTFMHWRRKWQPTPVFLPGESQGQRSLVGFRLLVTQSRTQLTRLSSSSSSSLWRIQTNQRNHLHGPFDEIYTIGPLGMGQARNDSFIHSVI